MVRTVNLIEAILWMVISFCFLVSLVRPGSRRAKSIAAGNFLAFGASDLIEMQTGAWWRPWWLLVWKGACVAVMLTQFVCYVRRTRKRPRDTTGN